MGNSPGRGGPARATDPPGAFRGRALSGVRPLPGAPRRVRVLIAEDAAELRQLLRLTLERDPDLEVMAAVEDGDGALRVARERQPDVVVIDLAMPGALRPGEMLQELRKAAPTAAIIVYSGTDPAALDPAAAEDTVDLYLPKATDLSVVRRRVTELGLLRQRARGAG